MMTTTMMIKKSKQKGGVRFSQKKHSEKSMPSCFFLLPLCSIHFLQLDNKITPNRMRELPPSTPHRALPNILFANTFDKYLKRISFAVDREILNFSSLCLLKYFINGYGTSSTVCFALSLTFNAVLVRFSLGGFTSFYGFCVKHSEVSGSSEMHRKAFWGLRSARSLSLTTWPNPKSISIPKHRTYSGRIRNQLAIKMSNWRHSQSEKCVSGALDWWERKNRGEKITKATLKAWTHPDSLPSLSGDGMKAKHFVKASLLR